MNKFIRIIMLKLMQQASKYFNKKKNCVGKWTLIFVI